MRLGRVGVHRARLRVNLALGLHPHATACDPATVLEVRGKREIRHADRSLRAALDPDRALTVELEVPGGRLQLVGGDREHRLAGLRGGPDHRVADAVGGSARERAHVVRPGVGVGGVDDDRLDRHAQRLGRDLADDGLEALAEVHGRERHHERAHRRGVDQRLRRIPAEVHSGRIVDRGDAAAAQPGHRHAPSGARGAELIAACSAVSSWPTSRAAACMVSIRVASSAGLRCGRRSPLR